VTSAHGGTHVPGGSGGNTAAGASPEGASPRDAATRPVVEDRATGDPDAQGPDLGELSLEEAIHQVEEVEHEGRPPAAGPLTNVVVALVVLALGAAALLGSNALGLGTAAGPAAGTWPLLVAIVTVLIGLGLLAAVRHTHDAERFTGASLLVLVGLATMVLFVVLLPVIGFEIPAALLCFVWLRFLGREGWRLSLLLSLGLVAAFYAIFVGALSVPIPHLF
jgi:putative tricarboxylic transport membrane protein